MCYWLLSFYLALFLYSALRQFCGNILYALYKLLYYYDVISILIYIKKTRQEYSCVLEAESNIDDSVHDQHMMINVLVWLFYSILFIWLITDSITAICRYHLEKRAAIKNYVYIYMIYKLQIINTN